MREQGHLCAYCMRRIPDDRIMNEDTNLTNIYNEHIIPRSDKSVPGYMALDYTNMLAVCSGNEKEANKTIGHHKKRFLTCDKKRNDKRPIANPLDKKTIDSIYYSEDGTIKSNDECISEDLNNTLNLNCHSDGVVLPENRKAVLDEIQANIYKDINSGEISFLEACSKYLKIFENEKDYKMLYIGIVICWLKSQF